MLHLYRYIDLKNEYWSQPLTEGVLYFSEINQTRTRNDKSEFCYKMDSRFTFYKEFGHYITSSYDSLFAKTRLLCLSQRLVKRTWDEYCTSEFGGICYQFTFNKQQCKKDLSPSRIVYSKDKEINLSTFIYGKTQFTFMKEILKKTTTFSNCEKLKIHQWIKSTEPHKISIDHIVNELALKKTLDYRYEHEVRYVHVYDPQTNNVTQFNKNFTLSFEDLGLTLVKIFTNNEELVRKTGSSKITIKCPTFLTPLTVT